MDTEHTPLMGFSENFEIPLVELVGIQDPFIVRERRIVLLKRFCLLRR